MKHFLFTLAIVLPSILLAQTTAKINVLVTNFNQQPISKDKIVFVGQSTKKTITKLTDAHGKFTVELPAGETYEIQIDVLGQELDYNTVEIPTLPEGAEFETMELQILYEMPSEIILSDLHFKTGSAEIEASSKKVLDQLADYLKRKPTLTIEVVGHTDNVGDDAANLKLSQQRADAVKRYLISKGITTGRIKTKGMGETKPIASNDSDEGRAENRRTEIKVL